MGISTKGNLGLPSRRRKSRCSPHDGGLLPDQSFSTKYAEKPRQSYFQSYTVIGHADCPIYGLPQGSDTEIELIDRSNAFR